MEPGCVTPPTCILASSVAHLNHARKHACKHTCKCARNCACNCLRNCAHNCIYNRAGNFKYDCTRNCVHHRAGSCLRDCACNSDYTAHAIADTKVVVAIARTIALAFAFMLCGLLHALSPMQMCSQMQSCARSCACNSDHCHKFEKRIVRLL